MCRYEMCRREKVLNYDYFMHRFDGGLHILKKWMQITYKPPEKNQDGTY